MSPMQQLTLTFVACIEFSVIIAAEPAESRTLIHDDNNNFIMFIILYKTRLYIIYSITFMYPDFMQIRLTISNCR